jgi:TonB-linked SusC/RagA family outer membrane protein
VSDYYNTAYTTFLQYSLNYSHTFAKAHTVQAMVLYEQQSSNGNQFSAFRYETLNSDQLAAGSATNQTGTSNAVNPSTSKSYVGTLHYDYLSRYLVDFTIRRDGSSLFPPAKQYGVFPGVTAAYRVSEEPFFKAIKELTFIDNFKIRGSYGVMGDASGASGYNFVGGYNYPITGGNSPGASISSQYLPAGSVFDGNFVNGLGFRGLVNPEITWYTARTADVGIDLDLWHGLFSVTADYFNRNRSGLLGTELLSIPGSVGAGLPQVNLNSDQTRGYELSITNNDKIDQVGLRISGNVSYSRTKWLTYVKAPQGSTYADWVNNGSLNGRYNDVWFGYGYVGQFQSFQQIRSYTVNQGGGNRGILPGDYIYQDYNHDGYFDAGDLHPIAGSNPTSSGASANQPALVNFGLSLGANYKGFDINAELQGAADKWIQLPFYYSYPLDHGGNTFSEFTNDWHPTDPTANPYNPNTVYTPGKYAYTGTNINQSALAPGGIVNAAYVRLKSIELGYTFPNKWTNKVFKSLRVFVNGYNLLTVTGKGLNGIDPEHPTDLNATQYPIDHTFSAGINAKF